MNAGGGRPHTRPSAAFPDVELADRLNHLVQPEALVAVAFERVERVVALLPTQSQHAARRVGTVAFSLSSGKS
jgi:hypothetical protein